MYLSIFDNSIKYYGNVINIIIKIRRCKRKMAAKQEFLDYFAQTEDPISAHDISEHFESPIGEGVIKEKIAYHPSTISNNLYALERDGLIKFSHKDGRRKYYVQVDVVVKVEVKQILMENGEPISEEYEELFSVEPIDGDVNATIQNIRVKVLTDGKLSPEQKEYMNAKIKQINRDNL